MTSDTRPKPSEVDAAPKPVVFIGSSSEARNVLSRLVITMGKDFEPHPWTSSFKPGTSVLEVLTAEIGKADAALLIFAKDDGRDFRDEHVQAARDNVVLEYGFFVSKLGRQRVWILEEDGVGLPSDVLGLTTVPFSRDSDAALGASIDLCVQAIRENWLGNVPATEQEIADSNLGLINTLRSEKNRFAETVSNLRAFAEDQTPRFEEPLILDSARSAISAYSEGLDRVERRFWTTTFLSSGFWTRPQPGVIDANARMLRRLRETNGEARRLFLLDQPAGMVAEAHRQHRVTQRQLEKFDELDRLTRYYLTLKTNVARMMADGFEARVVFDANQLFQSMSGMLPDPADNELAIYDDNRIDVFAGGRLGVVSRVTIYLPLLRDFAGYSHAANEYFQDLWDASEPMQSFIDQLEQATASADTKIDYASNWLAMYEFGLDADDQALKTVEIERVKEVLRARGRWGGIKRYLDVGTCTGRYPIQLREAVAADGEIVAIDEDYDCFRFADASRDRHCADDQRMRFILGDFGAHQLQVDGTFDLITCMLGTLSHFGWDRRSQGNEPFDDSMQRALVRMASLLADDGFLMLGTWSKFAKERSEMLGIYRDTDRRRLAAWTPDLDELNQRLEQAGLRVTEQSHPEVRLDFTMCTRV